jgi:hypothetical protein
VSRPRPAETTPALALPSPWFWALARARRGDRATARAGERYLSDPAKEQAYYSYAIASKEVVDVSMPLGANFAWDAFWRAAYDRAALSGYALA